MATFFADSILTAATKAANTQATVALPAHWDAIVPTANIRGYNKLRSIMLGRGFTAAEFASWGSGTSSDGYDWNKRLGVLYAFLEASKGDEDRGAAYLAELKELFEELETLPIVISDEVVLPTGSNGRIGSGSFDTSDDRFTLDDPDGEGRYSVGDGTQL